MTELSLFTGIGGGLLGTSCLLGWKCIGAVEYEKYPCQVLQQRITDGCFEPFPIYCMDIREFNRRIAPMYTGVVDVITAGFPYQPFSVAGKRRGNEDERNMWPATIECIRVVRPRHLLLENVPGLLTHEYVRRIYGDLAESGYTTPWRCLSAAEVGAPHKRVRWFVVANTDCKFGHYSRYGLPEIRLSNSLDAQTIWNRQSEPAILGMDNDVPHRVDRLKAIGNGQVPLCAATAWKLLSRLETKDA